MLIFMDISPVLGRLSFLCFLTGENQMQKIETHRLSNQAQKHFDRREKVWGQFFTPKVVSDFIVKFSVKHIIGAARRGCDPSCGDGVFVSSLLEQGFEPLGVDIDKNVLQRIPLNLKKYVKIQNGLEISEDEKFDLVVGNPPFSSKYGRIGGEILRKFNLGKGRRSQAIEILFLEKFLRLTREGGVIGIILPHGIFSNVQLSYVREFIRSNLRIIAVISLPRNIFRNSQTSSKTCILIGRKEKNPSRDRPILFAAVESLDELLKGELKNSVKTTPNEFLYPEFYLDINPVLVGLPKLKDFWVEIRQGRTLYGKERTFSKTGIPFISAKTFTEFGLDLSRDRKFVLPGSKMDFKKAHVRVGELLFVRVGVGCIGRTAVITDDEEKGIADDWIYIIEVKDARISAFYLHFWLQTPMIQKEIRRLARGVGTVTIPIKLLKEVPVLVPRGETLDIFRRYYLEMTAAFRQNDLEKAMEFKRKAIELIEEQIEKAKSLVEKAGQKERSTAQFAVFQS
ncbi:MAG: hypothetical protein DRQ10_05545 [Candidatus Hydrothermota bacterium]|nr:MAG: hypothetical protein DRQ10_05545 [Candidatus Hydrothermae bacterium]